MVTDVGGIRQRGLIMPVYGAVEISTPFSEWLERTMQERGLSIRQVAAYARVAPSTVSLWLRGLGDPRRSSLEKLAAGLSVPFEELWRLVGSGTAPADTSELDAWYETAAADLERWMAQGQTILDRLRRRRAASTNNESGAA